MVASIGKGTAAQYYLRRSQYYISGKEPAGVWLSNSARLGIAVGQIVKADQFEKLHAGIGPYGELLITNSGCKTQFMLTVADLLTLNGYPFAAFQADDKKRLSTLIGTKVVDLRPNPDLIMNEPALVRRSFTPLYTAASKAVANNQSVLFDIGADEVENAANFIKDVDLDEDLVSWKLPAFAFVLVQAEIDAIISAAETIRRFREALPSATIVLVENLLDRGALESLRNTGPARAAYEKELKPLLTGVERLVMPAIIADFWEPYENAGLRFLKASRWSSRWQRSASAWRLATSRSHAVQLPCTSATCTAACRS